LLAATDLVGAVYYVFLKRPIYLPISFYIYIFYIHIHICRWIYSASGGQKSVGATTRCARLCLFSYICHLYISIYQSIYLSIYLYLSISISIYIHIHICRWIYSSSGGRQSVGATTRCARLYSLSYICYLYISIYQSIYLSIYLYLSISLYIYIYIHIFRRIYSASGGRQSVGSTTLCARLPYDGPFYTYIHIYIYIHTHTYIYIYTYTYIYIYTYRELDKKIKIF